MLCKALILNKINFFGTTAADVFERIKYILGVSTSKELANRLQLSESGISSAIKRNSIPYQLCADLASTHGIPLDWIIFGDVDGNAHIRVFDPLYFDRVYLQADFDSLPELVKNSQTANFISVALYDTPASAGNGSFFDDERIIQHVPFDAAWLKREGLYLKNLACLPIKGDSMMPGLIDGDIVLINRAVTRGDGVFVLRLGDALRIKRLQWLADGRIRISSDNSLYQPETIDPAELAEQFEIIGSCHTKISRVS
ncbi:LexA family transcriptional regulator [Neisseria sp. S1]|uniref:LexA family transcriptional regulator n=1 Tax=Neisseria sp. S1 TaxID=3318354 RepID=UPI003A861907